MWFLDHDDVKPQRQIVDVNSASAEEFDTLSEIGKTRAEAIIKGRPYSGTEELVSRHILPKNVYDAIKDNIVVGQR